MKKTFTTLGGMALFLALSAQTTVKRTPVYEVFSSSTCPPCKPANDHLVPQFEARHDQIAVVKYQMSWPGTGDPYYTASGNTRRNYYGVNSIPDFFDNSVGTSYSAFDTTDIDADLQEDVSMAMGLRYVIDPSNQTIKIKARVEALDNYTAGAHRLMIIVTEKINYKNKKSNGETEFHHVFKKMLPTATGDFIVGALAMGDTLNYEIEYQFQGNYRLPNNSSDKIDDDTEHSVEDFENLHVIMFMQSAEPSKEIYQAANGEHSKSEEDFNRAWDAWPTAVNEVESESSFNVFPNPSNGIVNVVSANGALIQSVELVSVTGEIVMNRTFNNETRIELNTANVSAGIYLMNIKTENGMVTRQLSVFK
ncbi:MAG: T9SS type A sorting domain-containing protein [Salibacteraceae bacterium]|nr:T9SS type A sorting domain-containing protein [Salibacteraceae bacterium]